MALLVLPSVAAPPFSPFREGEETGQFLQRLRSRGLFGLAEAEGFRRLNDPRTPREERLALTVALAATMSEHGDYLSDAERVEMWQRADNLLTDMLATELNPEQQFRFQVELAQLRGAHLNWLRWQGELAFRDPQYQQRVNEAHSAFTAASRNRPDLSAPNPEDGVLPSRLGTSENKVLVRELRLAEAKFHLDAHWFETPEERSRLTALQGARKTLQHLAEGSSAEPHSWLARVALLTCLRLQGAPAEALQVAHEFLRKQPPDSAREAVQGERILSLAEQRNWNAARSVLQQSRGLNNSLSGDVAVAWGVALQQQWQAAQREGRQDQAASLFQELEEHTARSRRAAGGLYSLRCEWVLQSVREERKYGPRIAPLVSRAEREYRAGQLKAAAKQYGDAARLAREEQHPDLDFRLTSLQGALQIQSADWHSAASLYAALVARQEQHPQVATADLLAAYTLGKLATGPDVTEYGLRYAQALAAHRRKYSSSTTALEATWLLAIWREQQGEFTAALALFDELAETRDHGPAARVGAARALLGEINRLREPERRARDWETTATARFEKWLPVERQRMAAPPLSLAESDLALWYCRFLLDRPPPAFAASDAWLERVLASLEKNAPVVEGELQHPPALLPAGELLPPATVRNASGIRSAPQQRVAALQMKIISLAGQGSPQRARELLQRIARQSQPRDLLNIAEGLAPVTLSPQHDPHHDLGELQLETVRKIPRQQLSPDDQRRLDLCLALAYAQTKQFKPAMQVYSHLLAAEPRDRRLLQQYVSLLRQCDSAECRSALFSTLNQIERLEKPGSPAWLAARLDLCECLRKQNRIAECRKLLAVTRLLYPPPTGSPLAARFAELERRVGGPPAP